MGHTQSIRTTSQTGPFWPKLALWLAVVAIVFASAASSALACQGAPSGSGDGDSGGSSAAIATPSGFIAAPDPEGILLSWDELPSDACEFVIVRSETDYAAQPFSEDSDAVVVYDMWVADSSDTSFVDIGDDTSGLDPTATYYYSAFLVDSNGDFGEPAQAQTAPTASMVLTVAADKTAVPYGRSTTLRCSMTGTATVTAALECSTDDGGTWAAVASYDMTEGAEYTCDVTVTAPVQYRLSTATSETSDPLVLMPKAKITGKAWVTKDKHGTRIWTKGHISPVMDATLKFQFYKLSGGHWKTMGRDGYLSLTGSDGWTAAIGAKAGRGSRFGAGKYCVVISQQDPDGWAPSSSPRYVFTVK